MGDYNHPPVPSLYEQNIWLTSTVNRTSRRHDRRQGHQQRPGSVAYPLRFRYHAEGAQPGQLLRKRVDHARRRRPMPMSRVSDARMTSIAFAGSRIRTAHPTHWAGRIEIQARAGLARCGRVSTTNAPAPLARDELRHRRMSPARAWLQAEMSARRLSYVERGKVRASRETVARLADALGMPQREHRTDGGEPSGKPARAWHRRQ
jgi:hypothetical protein